MMELHFLGRPTIPPKEGYYIARGRLTCGGMHKKPKFVADFYIPKPYDPHIDGQHFFDIFVKSVRRFKKETDTEFLNRCYDKWGQHYIFYHYEDGNWCCDGPAWETMEKMRKMREVS